MPAMSPTMTEGNIANWKLKEGNETRLDLKPCDALQLTMTGDSFSAGDVLLEIETDKAQMDVEAQDDGVLAKIMVSSSSPACASGSPQLIPKQEHNGAKSVKVGSRIAVMAEEGDEIASMEIPPEDSAASSKSSTQQPTPSSTASESGAETPPTASPSSSSSSPTAQAQPQRYPLYPSVQHLVHTKGLDNQVDQIPASGPNGRLLKGDVLSYIGQINKDYSSKQSSRISQLGNLDLSNIQRAAPKTPEKEVPAQQKPAPEPVVLPPEPEETEVSIHVSLAPVRDTMKRIQESLGFPLHLHTIIARACELGNAALPRPKAAPTQDELFAAIIGQGKTVPKRTRGYYIPRVTALPSNGSSIPMMKGAPGAMYRRKKLDIIDMLTSNVNAKATLQQKSRAAAASSANVIDSGDCNNILSVMVKKGEEMRAKTFLERVKTLLESEPGRLVL
ncbi:MAG: pyridoxine biosynthesis protein [Alyxoria varia]|nr:MAG: pyridoxine biosynthesis protein [Alyxoria varia]